MSSERRSISPVKPCSLQNVVDVRWRDRSGDADHARVVAEVLEQAVDLSLFDLNHQPAPAAFVGQQRRVAATHPAANLDKAPVGDARVLEQGEDDAILFVLGVEPEAPRKEIVRGRQRHARQLQRPHHRVHLTREDDVPFALRSSSCAAASRQRPASASGPARACVPPRDARAATCRGRPSASARALAPSGGPAPSAPRAASSAAPPAGAVRRRARGPPWSAPRSTGRGVRRQPRRSTRRRNDSGMQILRRAERGAHERGVLHVQRHERSAVHVTEDPFGQFPVIRIESLAHRVERQRRNAAQRRQV